MAISKSKREAVYRKYDGHCAYCGREIAYKNMQVDHFQPLRAWGIEDAGTDDLDNLMPACRMCNHYKRANSLETFRRYIEEIPRKLHDNYIYKVGIVYGEIAEQAHPVKFYFEQQEAMIDDAPTADVAPVVRCMDCKHLVAVNVNGKGIPTCRVSGMEVAPDEFCSRGEKGRR